VQYFVNKLMDFARIATGQHFKVVEGRFGPRVTLTGPWSEKLIPWMRSKGVTELELNRSLGCEIEDGYSFLQELPFLTGLRLVGQCPKDFSPILSIRGLRALEIELTEKPKGLELGRLDKLEILVIDWFSGAESLFECGRLRELSIDGYPGSLGSLPFGKLVGLQDLRLAGGGLTEIGSFAELSELRRLQLLDLKHLQSLRGIEGVCALQRLRIDGCTRINSIEPVRNLSQLEFLWMVDCGDVESLKPVQNLHKLKSLLFGGRTVIKDGDISVLLELQELSHWGFANLKHYNLRQDDSRLIEKRHSNAGRLRSYHF
jgi:hypothetical protein